MPAKKRVAIVGAGVTGLAAAYDLTESGHQVTLYESANQVGGLSAGFKAPHWDWSVDKFYHHWFASDKHILDFIEKLGWTDQVLFPRPETVIYWDGEFHPFDSIYSNIPLFILRHFAPLDVVRYGLAGIYLRFFARWEPLEGITADAWTRRWFGERIYELQWWPLLVSKFGEKYAREVTMAWLWARLKSRTTRLGTFVGGFQAFLDRLADQVRSLGVEVRLSEQVMSILQDGANGSLTVTSAYGPTEYDAVISTCSPQAMMNLAPDLPQSYSRLLGALNSMGAVVLVLSLKHKLTDHYWHNLPKDAGFPFMALVEHTNYVGSEHFGGEHIVYCGDYRDTDHEYFALSTDELKERFLPVLIRFNPDFDRDWVTGAWSWQATYAQPVPPVNHSRNIPALRTPIPGLYFASMSQIYPWDRGTNYAVELAQRVSRQVNEDLAA